MSLKTCSVQKLDIKLIKKKIIPFSPVKLVLVEVAEYFVIAAVAEQAVGATIDAIDNVLPAVAVDDVIAVVAE